MLHSRLTTSLALLQLLFGVNLPKSIDVAIVLRTQTYEKSRSDAILVLLRLVIDLYCVENNHYNIIGLITSNSTWHFLHEASVVW